MKNLFSLATFVLFLLAFSLANESLNTNSTKEKSTNTAKVATSNTNGNKLNSNLNVFFKSQVQAEKHRNKVKKMSTKKFKKTNQDEKDRLKKLRFKKLNKAAPTPTPAAAPATPKPAAQQVTTAAALIPTDKNKLVNHEKFKIVLENWMKISSPQFKDVNVFPEVLTPDYEVKTVPINDFNFRINPFYKKKVYGDKNYPPSRFHFWFRYSDKNLYYTADPQSLKVLGNVSLKEINDIKESDDPDLHDCLIIQHNSGTWNICTDDRAEKNKWLCQIKKDLGGDVESCHKLIIDNLEPTVIEKKITQPIILIPHPAKDCNENWNYAKNGDDWECDCSDGKEQSPIDIPSVGSGKAVLSPVKPVFYYQEAPIEISTNSADGYYVKGDNVKITYTNGYISIKHPNLGTVVTLDGVVYNAEEVRFHTPSEHTIDGKHFDMEIEVIHYGQTKGDLSKQLIFNILVEKYPGVYNKFIDDLDMFNLPNPLNPSKPLNNKLHLNKLLYSSDEEGYLNMKYFNFYTYMGSLTAPPCTQQTIHLVTANPIKLGSTALQLFKEAIRVPDVVDPQGNIIINNKKEWSNRKTQSLNGRKVYYYKTPYNTDELAKVEVAEKPGEGHYEKVTKKYTSYYKVSGPQPSGMPGAFVVSESEATGKKI